MVILLLSLEIDGDYGIWFYIVLLLKKLPVQNGYSVFTHFFPEVLPCFFLTYLGNVLGVEATTPNVFLLYNMGQLLGSSFRSFSMRVLYLSSFSFCVIAVYDVTLIYVSTTFLASVKEMFLLYFTFIISFSLLFTPQDLEKVGWSSWQLAHLYSLGHSSSVWSGSLSSHFPQVSCTL